MIYIIIESLYFLIYFEYFELYHLSLQNFYSKYLNILINILKRNKRKNHQQKFKDK